MLKHLNFKRYIKYIPLFMIMFMSMLLITAPIETKAQHTSDFEAYDNEVHKGTLYGKSGDNRLQIYISYGPASDIAPPSSEVGRWTFFKGNKYVDINTFYDLNIGDALKFNTSTKKWELLVDNGKQFIDYSDSYHKAYVNLVHDDYIMLRIEFGPAKNVDPNNEANEGIWFFDKDMMYLENSNTSSWTVGTEVEFNPEVGKWTEVIKENMRPVLNGETAFVTNIDNLITVDQILSSIEAIDEEDGNITHLIQIDSENSTYNTNITDIGDYVLKLYVIDSEENRADLTVHILVKDIAEPIINGTKTYNQSYTSKKDVGTILSSLTATDNYDETVQVKVKTDNYTPNFNKIGSYDIIFYATDSSGNEGLFTVTVNVIDDVSPIFTGPISIMKGQSETLTLEQILNQINVNDVIDTNVSYIVISDNYTGYGNKVGNWTIVLEATDSSNNKSTHTITITVKDNIPPVFYVDNFFVHVDDIVNLTRDDIINLLIASGQLQVSGTTTFSFPLNEYEGNESIAGIYAVMVKSTSNDGTEKQVSLAIQVNETDGLNDDDIVVEEEDSFFTKAWTYIKDSWDWIKTPTVEEGKFYKGYYILIGIGVFAFIGILFKKRN